MISSTTPPDKSPIMPHGAGDDVNERFSRMNQEYQRIKSQNAILKKAVIQEQQKVATLEKDLREAEQKLRQNVEDTDILQFNNQRLTKRITVLQEELVAKSKEGGWLFGSRDNKKSEELEVIRQELEDKIIENAQLHVEKRDLEEDIKQSAQLHTDQTTVLKACVIAKQEEVDQAAAEGQKMTETLAQLRDEMERQSSYFKESEEKLGREVQQIIAEVNQSRKKHKLTILNPNAAPPSPLSIWRDNKHTRELIGTFKDLYYAVESHWDTHLDKITILRGLSPPEQLSLIYKEIASTIPSLSTQMTHIAESLHQYLPVLFSKDALPNIEFADTLHRFVNTCKKWLSYQQLRHVELSQQGTGPHPQAHTALADVYVQVLRALDRLVADREVSAIRSLCGVLAALTDSARAVYAMEAAGTGEGGLAKNADEGVAAEGAIVAVNERLLETQTKTVALLDKFATKLDEYESLAGSGRLLQEGEDSHRLREIASHLIMLNNDINVASKEREMHHLSVLRESDSFKHKLRELEDQLKKKGEELNEQGTRWSVTKEQTQELDKVRNEKSDQEKSFAERQSQLAKDHAEKQDQMTKQHAESQNQLTRAHEQALAGQKTQLEADHAQILSASLARSQSDLDTLRQQLDTAQRSVEQLRQELSVQQKRADDAEQLVRNEQQRLAAQSQDMNAQEGRAQDTQRSHETQVAQLKSEVEAKQKQVQANESLELQSKSEQVERSARTELAEKAQQVKVLQQKLMMQEQRLEERTKQVQAAERIVADKEQQLVKLRENPQPASSIKEPSAVSLIDADIHELAEPHPTLSPSSFAAVTPSLLDDTVPLIPVTPVTPVTPVMPVTNNGPKYSMTVVDQAGNQSDSINESVADREREQALREFYEGKIEHITTQAKASDSKAVQLYEQYSSLLKALEDKEAERNELLDKIKAADQETKTSKEDLESTRTNYDTQLRLLSDHLLELGEKIIQLEAEASAIKGCKVSCGKCKTWNTIEWLMGEGRAGQRCVKGNHPLSTFML